MKNHSPFSSGKHGRGGSGGVLFVRDREPPCEVMPHFMPQVGRASITHAYTLTHSHTHTLIHSQRHTHTHVRACEEAWGDGASKHHTHTHTAAAGDVLRGAPLPKCRARALDSDQRSGRFARRPMRRLHRGDAERLLKILPTFCSQRRTATTQL